MSKQFHATALIEGPVVPFIRGKPTMFTGHKLLINQIPVTSSDRLIVCLKSHRNVGQILCILMYTITV